MFLYVYGSPEPVSLCLCVFSGLLGLFPFVFTCVRASWACFLMFLRGSGPPGLASLCLFVFSGLRGLFLSVFTCFLASGASPGPLSCARAGFVCLCIRSLSITRSMCLGVRRLCACVYGVWVLVCMGLVYLCVRIARICLCVRGLVTARCSHLRATHIRPIGDLSIKRLRGMPPHLLGLEAY